MVAASVEERILDNVIETLRGISEGDTYHTDVRRVYLMTSNVMEVPEMPAIIVVPMASPEAYRDACGVTVHMKMALVCGIEAQPGSGDPEDPTPWARDVRRLAVDARRALRVDHTRGGLAVDTAVDEAEVFDAAPDTTIAGAQVLVDVHFRHHFTDPTSAY